MTQLTSLPKPLPSTVRAFKALLETDPNITTQARPLFVKFFRDGCISAATNSEVQTCETAPRILRRAEAAKRLGMCVRSVDSLPVAKVKLPGRKRAAGFREADINALIAGKAVTK